MFEMYDHIESKSFYQKGKFVPRELIQSVYAYKGPQYWSSFRYMKIQLIWTQTVMQKWRISSHSNNVVLLPVATF